MKEFKIPIDSAYYDTFFCAIRNKKDVIKLLMNTVKYVQTDAKVEGDDISYLHIIIDDMNRFIYESEDKVFSIRSPFNINVADGAINFYTKNISKVDSRLSSQIISLLSDENFDSPNSLDFTYLLEETFGEADEVWAFVMELLSFEDGYLRFDHDPKNEDKRKHPLNHLDICYTTASTYKIGTYNKPCAKYMTSLLSNKVDSMYLER
ncbi:hypothetical protein ACUFBV_003978 [Vibrio harveyi]